MVQWVKNQSAVAWVAEEAWLIPSLVHWVKVSDVSMDAVQIQSLVQELPCAAGAAIKKIH